MRVKNLDSAYDTGQVYEAMRAMWDPTVAGSEFDIYCNRRFFADVVTLETAKVVREILPDASWDEVWGVRRAMAIGYEAAFNLVSLEMAEQPA